MSKKRLDLQMFADASAQLQNTTGAAGMTAEMKTICVAASKTFC